MIQEFNYSIADYTNCVHCGECGQLMTREYLLDNVTISDGIKTLGGLADKNDGKFSADEKAYIKEKNRTKKDGGGKLPEGWEPLSQGVDGKFKAPSTSSKNMPGSPF